MLIFCVGVGDPSDISYCYKLTLMMVMKEAQLMTNKTYIDNIPIPSTGRLYSHPSKGYEEIIIIDICHEHHLDGITAIFLYHSC